jgi:hypothetical protein
LVHDCILRKVPRNFEDMGHRTARANSDTTTASGLLLMGEWLAVTADAKKNALIP